jgi:hypothetical protein
MTGFLMRNVVVMSIIKLANGILSDASEQRVFHESTEQIQIVKRQKRQKLHVFTLRI